MRSLTAKVMMIMLLTASTAFCQDFNLYGFSLVDYSFLGSGARARAMGGAFTGLSDDASALTWNPAGLIQVDRTQASVSGSFLPLRLKSDLAFKNVSGRDFSPEFTDDKLKLSYGSFVAPIRIQGHPFMASASYQSVQDHIADSHSWTDVLYYYTLPSSYGSAVATLSSRTTATGGLDQFSLGFGTGLYGDLSIGGSVNIYSGSWESAYNASFVDTVIDYFAGRPKDTVRVAWMDHVRDISDSKGYNFTAGFLFRKEKMRAGVTVRTPFEIITDHDLKRADTMYLIKLADYYPGAGEGTAKDIIRPTMYRGKTKIQVPLSLAFGGSYQATPELLLAADAEFRRSSETSYFVRIEGRPYPMNSLDSINQFTLPGSIYYDDTSATTYFNSAGELIEVYNEFKLEMKSSMQLRAGAEYLVKSQYGTIPIRGGIRFMQQPYRSVDSLQRDLFANPQKGFVLGSAVKRTVFAVGTGIHWRQIWLDLGMEMNTEKQTEKGTNALGEYSNERKRNEMSYIFNFTGFF